MKTSACIVAALSLLAGTALLRLSPAQAHDWYPRECCHGKDCAPVESMVWVVPLGESKPQLIVTSRHGAAVIPPDFPVRVSQDGRMHVCMQRDVFERMEVMCLFKAPGM